VGTGSVSSPIGGPGKLKRVITALAVLILTGELAGVSLSQTDTESILVPRHTVIPVILTKDIRVGGFGDAREEKKVRFDVEQDVIVGNYLVARKGDLAEGHYTTETNLTKRVFSADGSQELALDVDDVVNFCGDTIHMQFERTFVGGGRKGFLSIGTHAHDAVFSKGSVLEASTDRLEKSVCAEKTAQTMQPLPTDMIVPDEDAAPEPASAGAPQPPASPGPASAGGPPTS